MSLPLRDLSDADLAALLDWERRFREQTAPRLPTGEGTITVVYATTADDLAYGADTGQVRSTARGGPGSGGGSIKVIHV